MLTRNKVRVFFALRPVRLILFALGLLLMIATPAVAILPGPGGIFVFAAGLALALRNSDWAKRRYVHFKRWQPRAGRWADWGLRRGSHQRREALRKDRERQEAPPAHCVERTDDVLASAGMEVAPIDPTPAEVAPASPAIAPLRR
ncbi:hypothetical protein OMW55_05680 [Sphingomonas sp. BN140010]|uniref:Transmembrane protein PGPGW n=1 Tax=Sphingomonas arvum TaxID=2992113 RepID=A0ABT3JE07_9SPHN|nr:hypothetical protein [Sphingomonas sp. BN140010]MCW3797297.1 hypothetical protein [Sphingomonas sp. BN140010]